MAEVTQRAREYGLGSVVRANAQLYANRPAFIDGETRITWAEIEGRTNRLARALLELGIGRGDRIALLLNDGVQFVELLVAAGKIGAIAVLLNWRLAPAEISWILCESSPKALFRADRFAGLVAGTQGHLDLVIADDATAEARYGRWVTEGSDAPLGDVAAGDDPVFMMFTSGTTGRPKGCLHSHASTLSHAMAFVLRRGFTRSDVNLSTNPLFHVAGLGHALATLVVGGTNVFIPRDSSPNAPVELAVRHRCTISTLSAPLLEACKIADPVKVRAMPIRHLTSGAGMTDPQAFTPVLGHWDALLVGGWGQTETGGFTTFLDWPDMLAHPESIGWPMQHVEVAILDEAGLPLDDPQAVGELGTRGPNVMLGYWNNSEATEAALGTGWLRTGDIVSRDELGLLTLKGRSKELIKSGGENVYPVEVENVLKTLPGVADAVVAGVKDRKWGEAVKAFIVLAPGASLSPEAMTQACRASIAGYKRPRYLEFVDAIPRDHLGKIRRFELSAREVTDDQAVA